MFGKCKECSTTVGAINLKKGVCKSCITKNPKLAPEKIDENKKSVIKRLSKWIAKDFENNKIELNWWEKLTCKDQLEVGTRIVLIILSIPFFIYLIIPGILFWLIVKFIINYKTLAAMKSKTIDKVIEKVDTKIKERELLGLKAELAREHKNISDYNDEEIGLILQDKREKAIAKIKDKSLLGLLITLIIGI